MSPLGEEKLSSLLDTDDYKFYTRQFGKVLSNSNLKSAENNLMKYIDNSKKLQFEKVRWLNGGISTLEISILKQFKELQVIQFEFKVNKDYSFDRAYHILSAIKYVQRDYTKSEEFANEAIKWNIFDFDDMYLLTKIAEFEENNPNKANEIFFERIYPLIHMPNDLAKFYINLAKHFFIRKEYELSYACYKYGLKFNEDKDFQIEADKLRCFPQIMDYEYMSDPEIVSILERSNIPLNISNEMVNTLIKIHGNCSFIIATLIEKIFAGLNLEI